LLIESWEIFLYIIRYSYSRCKITFILSHYKINKEFFKKALLFHAESNAL